MASQFNAYDRPVQIYPPEEEGGGSTSSTCPCLSNVAPAMLFQFPSNNVLQYLIDEPEVTKDRVTIPTMLGNGTSVVYSGGYDAIYNAVDDKIYFCSDKVASGVTSHVLVQFDPRSLTITKESADLGAPSALQDVTDRTAWVVVGTSLSAYHTLTFAATFSASSTDPFQTQFTGSPSVISCASNQSVMIYNGAGGELELLTCLDSTSYSGATIASANSAVEVPALDDSGKIRRWWLPARNLLCLDYGGSAPVGVQHVGIIINLTDLTSRFISSDTYNFDDAWWDTLTQRVLASSGQGAIEVTASGEIIGTHGDDGNWDNSLVMPLGGTVMLLSTVYDGYGEFEEGVGGVNTTAVANYPTSSFTSGGETWSTTLGNPPTVVVLRGVSEATVALPDGAGVPLPGNVGVPLVGAIVDPTLGPPPFRIIPP